MFDEDYRYLMESGRLAPLTFLGTVLTIASTAYSSYSSSEQSKQSNKQAHRIERAQALARQATEREQRESIRRKMLRGKRSGVYTGGQGILGRPATERQELKTALGA